MPKTDRPRLLIEEWLPAAAIGVECMRERSTGQQPPDKRLHVWWARRPLAVSRAAVLGSLLPADFSHDAFERLLGFWGSARQVVDAQAKLEWVGQARKLGLISGRIKNPHGQRAFSNPIRASYYQQAHEAAKTLWGEELLVLDPMAGGGSIPLEAVRLGFRTLANEYNPVACSVIEAIVDYPFRFGKELAARGRRWGYDLRQRFNERVEKFFPTDGPLPRHSYIYACTVPCPDTGHAAPLVPDWHLRKPSGHSQCGPSCWLVVPVVDKQRGTWTVEIKQGGRGRDHLAKAPSPTYSHGKGISLFTGRPISADYIKTMAQQGQLKHQLYAVATKTPQGQQFGPPTQVDFDALKTAEKELERLRPAWEKANIILTEKIPSGDKTGTDPRARGTDLPLKRGETYWADMFTPRQLLCTCTLVEELGRLRPEILRNEGVEAGEAIIHLLAFGIDKLLSHNCTGSRWEPGYGVIKSKMERHDYGFKPAFAEMAVCATRGGLEWAIENVFKAYESLRAPKIMKQRA